MLYASYVTYQYSYLSLKFDGLSAGSVRDSKLSPVGAPTSVPNTLVSQRDAVGGSFKGGLRGRIDAEGVDAGEDDIGTSRSGGRRCQCDTAH
jgi:hypothetical protein